MADLESKILAKALGRLGGIGARWAAGRLPSVAYECRLQLQVPYEVAVEKISAFVAANGRVVPGLVSDPRQGSISGIVGSGRLNLNPTILYAHIGRAGRACTVEIRAVAKEGLVPQDSAKKLVNRVEELLKQ